MRILAKSVAAKHKAILEGWQKAFEFLGYSFKVWEPDFKPVYDAFDEFRPDIYISTGRYLPPVKLLAEYPRLKIIDRSEDLLPAFDHLRFKPGSFREDLECDVSFFGSYPPEKRDMINAYLFPILNSGMKVKLFGPDPMPFAECLGWIDDRDLPDLVTSSRVCLDISTRRQNGRYCTVTGLGGLVCTSRDLDSPEMLEMVNWYASWGAPFRGTVSSDNRNHILGQHTYFHRVACMLWDLKMNADAERLLNGITQ